jgi:hypothetical protein
MVLTVRVVIDGYTRRRVLSLTGGAGIAVAAAGCGLLDRDVEPEKPDPLQPVLDEALALAAAFDQAALAQPGLAQRLTPLAADHRAHVAELSRLIGGPAPSGPAPAASSAPPPAGEPAALLGRLLSAEKSAQRTAVAACRSAPAERAALVGSIAACRASHAEALR